MAKAITAVRMDILLSASRAIREEYNADLYNMASFGEDKLILGMNWCAIGTVSPDKAIEFANGLHRLAEFCGRVNGLELEIDRDSEDAEIKCREDYLEAGKIVAEYFTNGNFEAIYWWLFQAASEK